MKKITVLILSLAAALSLSAQEQKIRFACIGDGITRGGYPEALGRMLGKGFEVRDFGVDGATAVSYASSEEYGQLKIFEPDIVTIMLGANDAAPGIWNDKAYARGLRDLVNYAKTLSKSCRVIILTPLHATDSEFRDSIIRQPLLKVTDWVRINTEVELLDLYWPLRAESEGHLSDGVHPDSHLDSLVASRIAHSLPLKSINLTQNPYIPPRQQDVRNNIARWQDYKFGMFIHWGAYSQRGIVESWSLAPNNLESCYKDRLERGEGFYEYMKNYETLQWSFNPLQFDPSKWARAARNAGMKYLVFTTKHHDGFCMFDTRQTDYKVTDKSCPFSRDSRANIAREVFDAFRAEGLVTGAYFSTPDWHNEDYWYPLFPPRNSAMNYDVERFPEKWARYNDYVNAQLEELSTGYGPLNVIWFDMPCLPRTTYAPMDWERFEKTLRGNQPGIMMVTRALGGIYENYRTPEQEIPDHILDYPWESCMTMNSSWAWMPDSQYKSAEEIISMLVKVVSRGGNLLLNVGPRPDGTLDEIAYQRLEEIGEWMKTNSEGIYETKPYMLEGEGLYGTERNGTVYVFHIPVSDEGDADAGAPSAISVKGISPKTVSILGYRGKVKWTGTSDGFTLNLPDSVKDKIVCIKVKDAQHK